MVRSLPRSTWETSTKSFTQSAAAASLCTASTGVIQLEMLICYFCLLGFRPLEVLSRMTQGQINQNSLMSSVLVSSERHKDIVHPKRLILLGPCVRGHRGINQPNQFTGVGPCVSRTRGHRPTEPVHWGRPLCPTDARTLNNRNSSLGSALVSRGYKGIDQPN